MGKSFFGTDGIRGEANTGNITPAQMLKLGQALGAFLGGDAAAPRVLIGRDTRHSGVMIENALSAGLAASGVDVTLAGVVPTPAIGTQTGALGFHAGIMITASHNPFKDNGVKLFGPDGYKASDTVQSEINKLMAAPTPPSLVTARDIGTVTGDHSISDGYVAAVLLSLPDGFSLKGRKIGVDTANGAAFTVLPRILEQCGADLVSLGCDPNGYNINENCGSEYPETLSASVLSSGCDIGVALDGDADRIVMIDHKGQLIDGDQILATLASDLVQRGRLNGGAVVATIMSNLGLERYIQSLGLDFIRTKVGDRHVVAEMREIGANLGGEQSGHIILRDHSTTGDGTLATMHVLSALFSGKEATSPRRFDPVPQSLVNVRYSAEDPLSAPAVSEAIKSVEAELGENGRLVIRKSGTEPVIRVMVEAEDQTVANRLSRELAGLVERVE